MRHYALIGYPLGHSFSKRYFTEKFEREGITDASYDLLPLERIEALPTLLKQYPDLCGLNVTIPHKQTVIPLLDEIEESARAVGAVNCIRILNGRLKGYNTDTFGFLRSLEPWLPALKEGDSLRTALVLGTGGAAQAVAWVLRTLGMPVRFVSRAPAGAHTISYQTLRALDPDAYRLIVNATPLGMAPHIDQCPDLPFEQLNMQHFIYDLIYNPTETLLLQRAAARGCTVKNGLEMLYLQAEKSWEIWNDM